MYDYIIRKENSGFILYAINSNEVYFSSKDIENIYDEKNYLLMSHTEKNKLLPDNFFESNIGRYIDKTKEHDSISAPETVFFELTKKCNLRCGHCFNDSGIRAENELSLEEIFDIIDKLYDAGVFSIKVTGGEPFSRKDILSILEYLEEKGLNFIVYSNGTNIEPRYLSKLKSFKHLLKIRISIDGIEETNDSIRGKGTFKKAMETAKNLCENNIPCEINYTITKNNYTQLNIVAKYLENNNINCKINIGFVKIAGRAINGSEEYYFTEENIEEAVSLIKEQMLSVKSIKSFYLLEPIYYQLFGDSFGCPAARLTMTIKSNGDVYPCGLFSKNDSLLCGNLTKNSFDEIWESSAMHIIRSLPEREECKECEFYLDSCTGACRGNALNYFDNICDKDINCFVYQVDFNERRFSHE